MNEKKIIEALEMIAKDQADDAEDFEGAPFTGHTVAEYFGNQGAAIAALANIVKLLVESRRIKCAADGGGRLLSSDRAVDGIRPRYKVDYGR